VQIPWDLSLHTAAKHHVLERYLQAWWPIMLNSMPRVTYVEGFAGPGVYTKGEPGSPIIALRTLNAASALDKPVDLIFVDREPRCLARLGEEIRRQVPALRPLAHAPTLVQGNAADEIVSRLDALRAWDGGVFAFLDSWGNVAVPIDVVRRFARPKSEVFVTIGSRFWRQFGSSLDPKWDSMFGSSEWRAVKDVDGGPAKARFLADTYRAALRSAGFDYVLDFELVDERGEHFYLVHATTHDLGLTRMKDAVWAADPVRGVGFRDPRGEVEGQATFEFEWQPNLDPLTDLVRQWLREQPMTLDQVRKAALFETVYKEKHARDVVRTMLAEGSLRRTPAQGQLNGSSLLHRA
jgi:three-Cys-motif partner protein